MAQPQTQTLNIIGSQTALVTMSKGAAHVGECPHHASEVALVRQLTFAVTMAQPALTGERLHMAHFTSDMFFVGEIDVQDFLGRMQRLYPNRMERLTHQFRSKIAALV